jgi:DNA-binding NarL/FixJ family response regulator
MSPLTVLLVDDHPILRGGIRLLLTLDVGADVIAEAEDGLSALRLTTERNPDMIIMDVNLPLLDGLEATRQLIACHPDAKVVILTTERRDGIEREARDVGAVAFVQKSRCAVELPRAIHAVLRGESFFPSLVA